MNDLTQLIENLDEQELQELLSLIPMEIKARQEAQKVILKNEIISLYREVNELGRNIYTIKEIATLTKAKEYYVADIVREYKKSTK
jgi:hypothetical protein